MGKGVAEAPQVVRRGHPTYNFGHEYGMGQGYRA